MSEKYDAVRMNDDGGVVGWFFLDAILSSWSNVFPLPSVSLPPLTEWLNKLRYSCRTWTPWTGLSWQVLMITIWSFWWMPLEPRANWLPRRSNALELPNCMVWREKWTVPEMTKRNWMSYRMIWWLTPWLTRECARFLFRKKTKSPLLFLPENKENFVCFWSIECYYGI